MIPLKLLLLLLLLFLTSCSSTFLGNVPKNPEQINAENTTKVEPINLTNETEEKEEVAVVDNLFLPIKDNLSIFVMDVEGQSIIVLKEEESLLIDAGKETDSNKILRNIRNLGVDKLGYIILSNPKEENVGGLPYIIIQTSPAIVYESGYPSSSTSYQLYRELFPNKTLVPSDKLFLLEDTFIRMIVPYDEGKGFLDDLQDNSIITKITYRANSFLLMSNCGFKCIEAINNINWDADVLIIDGSCDSTTLNFLQKVSPEYVLITGELCKETEDRFKFLDIPLYSTRNDGNIRIVSDGEYFNIKYKK